jgi:hypothetical protein
MDTRLSKDASEERKGTRRSGIRGEVGDEAMRIVWSTEWEGRKSGGSKSEKLVLSGPSTLSSELVTVLE